MAKQQPNGIRKGSQTGALLASFSQANSLSTVHKVAFGMVVYRSQPINKWPQSGQFTSEHFTAKSMRVIHQRHIAQKSPFHQRCVAVVPLTAK